MMNLVDRLYHDLHQCHPHSDHSPGWLHTLSEPKQTQNSYFVSISNEYSQPIFRSGQDSAYIHSNFNPLTMATATKMRPAYQDDLSTITRKSVTDMWCTCIQNPIIYCT